MSRPANDRSVQDHRLRELERENETLGRQIYRMSWQYHEIRRELTQARAEMRRELGNFKEELHRHFFWLMLTLLTGLFILAALIVDFRMDLVLPLG